MFLSTYWHFGGRDKNIFEHLSKLHVARTKVDAGGKSILVIMSRNNNIISVLHGLVETRSFKEENRYVRGSFKSVLSPESM